MQTFESTRGKDHDSGHSAMVRFILGPQRQCSRAAVRGDLRIGCDEDDWGLMAGFSASQTYWMTIGIHFWVNWNHPG